MGWIGKNANLLTHLTAGSWVLLGALLVHDDLPADLPVRSSCGACTRCLDGCPTGAIVAPQTIDARRCISYLTIEHPGPLDAWEAHALGAWIFGCDVCQEVCPVNGEAVDTGPLRVPLVPLIAWLLPLGGRAFTRAVGATPLVRAGRHRLLRNAIMPSPMPASGRVTGSCCSAPPPTLGPRCAPPRSGRWHRDLLALERAAGRARVAAAVEEQLGTLPPCPSCAPFAGSAMPSTASVAARSRIGCGWRMSRGASGPPRRPDRSRLPAV